jgi:hypothetical protein
LIVLSHTTGETRLEIILVLVLIFMAGGLGFYFGKMFEGLRWSERAYINGRRLFFRGKQYKVRELPLPPSEQDD